MKPAPVRHWDESTNTWGPWHDVSPSVDCGKCQPHPCAHNDLVIEEGRASCIDCGRETTASMSDVRREATA